MATVATNVKPPFDKVITIIADYVLNTEIKSNLAIETARFCLMDALGCAMLALNFPACTKLLGPVVPGAILKNGVCIPGTDFILEPVQAAFNIGTMIRWLDFNDTWLAAEWGHPSDNLGAILAIADYVSRQNPETPIYMGQVLIAMIKAYEIQGCLALQNSFNKVGLDHVFLVKLASAAAVGFLSGFNKDLLLNTLSQVFVDGQSLRTYRHAPNTGSRKSWAAGDATSRAVRLALISATGEMGYPGALSADFWGFCDVSFQGKPLLLPEKLDSYVMENILFKLSYPAEFHAQTAIEAAIQLHSFAINNLDDIAKIILSTQEPAIRIISKEGPLHNAADRDHCLQYIVAIGLLFGNLSAEHYEDNIASDERIDKLRQKMVVQENLQFSQDYYDPMKRAIGNGIKIILQNGEEAEVNINYPIGHCRRRKEGEHILFAKFKNNLATRFADAKIEEIFNIMVNLEELQQMPVHKFMDLWVNIV